MPKIRLPKGFIGIKGSFSLLFRGGYAYKSFFAAGNWHIFMENRRRECQKACVRFGSLAYHLAAGVVRWSEYAKSASESSVLGIFKIRRGVMPDICQMLSGVSDILELSISRQPFWIIFMVIIRSG